jgi:hypothetical protein
VTWGGIGLNNGSHDISQLVSIFDGCKFSVRDTHISWHQGIDVKADATIQVWNGENNFNTNYKISYLENLQNVLKIAFETAEVCVKQTAANAQIQIRSNGGTQYTLDREKDAVATTHQAHASRWLQFIERTEKTQRDVTLTEPKVTEIIHDMYQHSDKGSEEHI